VEQKEPKRRSKVAKKLWRLDNNKILNVEGGSEKNADNNGNNIEIDNIGVKLQKAR